MHPGTAAGKRGHSENEDVVDYSAFKGEASVLSQSSGLGCRPHLLSCRRKSAVVKAIKPREAEGLLLGVLHSVSLQDARLLSHSSRNTETQPA